MNQFFASLLSVCVFLGTSICFAQSYEGKWNRTSLRFSVVVESWGDNCGVMPRSYTSKKNRPTDILQNNGHLFFSTGGLRTDKCNSPNPALVTLATSRSDHMWTRTCETPQSASKYEKIDYTLSGSGSGLTYTAESSFDWTLSGDRCVVSWIEKRVYTRDDGAEGNSSESPVVRVHADKKKKSAKSGTPEVATGCESPGPIKKLIIFPQNATVSPSRTLCFQLRGVDENGCRFAASAKWKVMQNGVPKGQLIDAKGCFSAGDNAAETEGVFDILVKSKGISAQTTIEVAYPDMGDLARARIDMSEELGDASELAVSPASEVEKESKADDPPVVTIPAKEPPKEEDVALLLVGLLVAASVVFIGLVFAMIWLLKRQHQSNGSSTVDVQKKSSKVAGLRGIGLVPPEGIVGKICPKCGEKFDDGKFCPIDATELIPDNGSNIRVSVAPPKGMICP